MMGFRITMFADNFRARHFSEDLVVLPDGGGLLRASMVVDAAKSCTAAVRPKGYADPHLMNSLNDIAATHVIDIENELRLSLPIGCGKVA